MSAHPQLWKVLIWFALCVALLLAILLELGISRSTTIPPAKGVAPMKVTPTVLLSELGLPPLETYKETTARPLFTPTRQPAPPPLPVTAMAPPKPAMKRGQFMLVGVTMTKDKNIALLREVAGGKTVRAERGQVINGLTVEKVEPEKVTLRFEGETEEVVLKIATGPRLPPTPQSQTFLPNPAVPNQLVPQPGQPMPVQPGQPMPAQPLQPAPPQPTPQAGGAQEQEAMQSLINRRRALRGLPPL